VTGASRGPAAWQASIPTALPSEWGCVIAGNRTWLDAAKHKQQNCHRHDLQRAQEKRQQPIEPPNHTHAASFDGSCRSPALPRASKPRAPWPPCEVLGGCRRRFSQPLQRAVSYTQLTIYWTATWTCCVAIGWGRGWGMLVNEPRRQGVAGQWWVFMRLRRVCACWPSSASPGRQSIARSTIGAGAGCGRRRWLLLRAYPLRWPPRGSSFACRVIRVTAALQFMHRRRRRLARDTPGRLTATPNSSSECSGPLQAVSFSLWHQSVMLSAHTTPARCKGQPASQPGTRPASVEHSSRLCLVTRARRRGHKGGCGQNDHDHSITSSLPRSTSTQAATRLRHD
jgi:hypothetical protein